MDRAPLPGSGAAVLALLSLTALGACSRPSTRAPATSASRAEVASGPRAAGPASDAERRARARWFPFELAAVQDAHGGDWAAFVAAAEAEDSRLAAAWQDEARRYPEGLGLRSAEDVRAVRVLQQEFERVARADPEAAIADARRWLGMLQRGAFAELSRECVQHDARLPDRAELCRRALEARRASIAAAVAGVSPASLSADALELIDPEPEAGTPGIAIVPFGRPAPAPSDPSRYPPTWQLELWWSGQVMPEANGPRYARPRHPDDPPGRWRFFDVVAPYSRRPSLRL